jgi:hypothetical protein
MSGTNSIFKELNFEFDLVFACIFYKNNMLLYKIFLLEQHWFRHWPKRSTTGVYVYLGMQSSFG